MLRVEVIRNNLETAETARISTTMKHQENIYSIYAYDTYDVWGYSKYEEMFDCLCSNIVDL